MVQEAQVVVLDGGLGEFLLEDQVHANVVVLYQRPAYEPPGVFRTGGNCGYFTRLPARLGTRPGLLAVSGTQALSGDVSYCSGARSTAQYHPWQLCG